MERSPNHLHQAHPDAAPIGHLISKALHTRPVHGAFRVAIVGILKALARAVLDAAEGLAEHVTKGATLLKTCDLDST